MNSKQIFKLLTTIAILVVIAYTAWILLASGWDLRTIRQTGKTLGVISALTFCTVIIPGIVRRLKLNSINIINVVSSHIMFARAQVGLLMFFTALGHYLLTIVIRIIRTGQRPEPQLFFVFGFLALFLSLFLALTSNQFSKKLLKTKWKTLHSLVYIIVWLIFAHTALIEINPISIIVGIFAVVETYSLVKAKFQS